jgi:hypothetical protein
LDPTADLPELPKWLARTGPPENEHKSPVHAARFSPGGFGFTSKVRCKHESGSVAAAINVRKVVTVEFFVRKITTIRGHDGAAKGKLQLLALLSPRRNFHVQGS